MKISPCKIQIPFRSLPIHLHVLWLDFSDWSELTPAYISKVFCFFSSPFTFGYRHLALQIYLWILPDMFLEGSLSSDFKQDSKSRFADAKPSYDHYSVTLAKLFNIFAPIYLQCGDDINSTYLPGRLWGENELILVKLLPHCLGDGKFYVLSK